MKVDYIITDSIKQAAVCELAGCDVTIQLDELYQTRVKYHISPKSSAEHAIAAFESGASLPARPLLDIFADLYKRTRDHIHQYKRLAVGKSRDIDLIRKTSIQES